MKVEQLSRMSSLRKTPSSSSIAKHLVATISRIHTVEQVSTHSHSVADVSEDLLPVLLKFARTEAVQVNELRRRQRPSRGFFKRELHTFICLRIVDLPPEPGPEASIGQRPALTTSIHASVLTQQQHLQAQSATRSRDVSSPERTLTSRASLLSSSRSSLSIPFDARICSTLTSPPSFEAQTPI